MSNLPVNEFRDTEPRPKRFYAVVQIASGAPCYVGTDLWDAAVALAPETCHWSADNAQEAVIWARVVAGKIRAAREKLGYLKSKVPNNFQIQN